VIADRGGGCAKQDLSWELRLATSLAWLWYEQGRSSDAHTLLLPVFERVTEGFATTDLIAARALLTGPETS
jgi:predicted ATPase